MPLSDVQIQTLARDAIQRAASGDFATAEPLLAQVAEARPNSGQALHLLGQARLKLGRFAEAREPLERAAKFLPREVAAHVNLAGCLIIGFISVFSDVKHVLGMDARLFLVTGFCGAFTTFSALILEASDLVRDGHAPRAFVYVLVSVAAGMLFFRAGEFLAERLT